MAFALKLGDGIESSNQVKYYGVMGDPGAHYKPVRSTGAGLCIYVNTGGQGVTLNGFLISNKINIYQKDTGIMST